MKSEPATATDRLQQQINFILEADKLKRVFRRTLLLDASRYENDAEHCWHVALMAILLSEYAKDLEIDVFRVVKMLLIHDLVEIDAGDTFCYDEAAVRHQKEREQKAADRVFSLLPPDQSQDLRSLWDEFEVRQTPEARFAHALDRFQPLLHNYHTVGISWRDHGVASGQVFKRNSAIGDGAPALWEHAKALIEEAVREGHLAQ